MPAFDTLSTAIDRKSEGCLKRHEGLQSTPLFPFIMAFPQNGVNVA